jgi:hypothetical protein
MVQRVGRHQEWGRTVLRQWFVSIVSDINMITAEGIYSRCRLFAQTKLGLTEHEATTTSCRTSAGLSSAK